jgi:hypothetical protein
MVLKMHFGGDALNHVPTGLLSKYFSYNFSFHDLVAMLQIDTNLPILSLCRVSTDVLCHSEYSSTYAINSKIR